MSPCEACGGRRRGCGGRRRGPQKRLWATSRAINAGPIRSRSLVGPILRSNRCTRLSVLTGFDNSGICRCKAKLMKLRNLRRDMHAPRATSTRDLVSKQLQGTYSVPVANSLPCGLQPQSPGCNHGNPSRRAAHDVTVRRKWLPYIHVWQPRSRAAHVCHCAAA